MLASQESALLMANPVVHITNNGPHGPQTWAEIITNKILYIGDDTHPAIKIQAKAFREQIFNLLVKEIRSIIQAERLHLKG